MPLLDSFFLDNHGLGYLPTNVKNVGTIGSFY